MCGPYLGSEGAPTAPENGRDVGSARQTPLVLTYDLEAVHQEGELARIMDDLITVAAGEPASGGRTKKKETPKPGDHPPPGRSGRMAGWFCGPRVGLR